MSTITLTEDQQNAYDRFVQFILDPHEQVFVLAGYSGTGKSTLVKTIVSSLDNVIKTAKLINSDLHIMDHQLTATTNKAAENLALITNSTVRTIYSLLGITVRTDYKTGQTSLGVRNNVRKLENTLIFVDEASYIDRYLLTKIFELTINCKIVFIGDPAQLVQVKSSVAPVFTSGFNGAELRKVVRQAEGNPIIELSAMFRNTVETGEFFSFKPDGVSIRHVPREEFVAEIKKEFVDPTWHHSRSKVLAWTNKRVTAYNEAINNEVAGQPELKIGDYAVCNNYICATGTDKPIKTDQMVCITDLSEYYENKGVTGRNVTLDNNTAFFLPNNYVDINLTIQDAIKRGDASTVAYVTNNWIDLRAAYSCTINKSQGSTYNKVFIDLDDVKKCRNPNQLARLLYVGVSRASESVIFTGDLI